jgi:hypothetical protein
MNEQNVVDVWVILLDEGTDTAKGTEAIELDNGLYKLLPTSDYDPEDEIWEFLPGSIVKCIEAKDHKGNSILLARELAGQAEAIEIYVKRTEEGIQKPMPRQAIDLQNGFYKLLPPEIPEAATGWQFPVNANVKCEKALNDKGETVLLAVRKAY